MRERAYYSTRLAALERKGSATASGPAGRVSVPPAVESPRYEPVIGGGGLFGVLSPTAEQGKLFAVPPAASPTFVEPAGRPSPRSSPTWPPAWAKRTATDARIERQYPADATDSLF